MTRIRFNRRVGAAAVTALVLLGVTACGSDSDDGSGDSANGDQTLTWALPAPPDSLDISKAINATSYTVYSAGLETLVHSDGAEIVPWLATEWTNPDPLTYVFELRDDVTFWNGDPMTADDVAFSIDRNTSPDSLISYDFTSIKSVESTGEHEVTVKLKNPDPLFLPTTIGTDALIVQKSFAEAAGNDIGTPDKLTMGTGPFQFTSFSKTSGVKLTRFDDYWGDLPVYTGVEFTAITDPETLRIALTQGQADGSFDANAADADRYEQSGNLDVALTPGLAFLYLSMDVREAPFDDVHVRKAIELAIDKAEVAKAAGGDAATPTDAMMSGPAFSTMFGEDGAGFTSQVDVPTAPDIDAAKAELAQSSSPDGFTTKVRFNADGSIAFQVLKEQLAPLGITLDGQQIDDNAFYDEIGAIDQPQGFRIILTGAGSTDPWESFRSFLGSSNTSGYSSDVTTSNLDLLSTETDPEKREAAVVAISQDLIDQAPFVPLFTYPKMLVLGKGWSYDDFKPRGSGWILNVRPAS